MSLVTVHTVTVNGQPDNKLVALNAAMISLLRTEPSGAHFTFTPTAGKEFQYYIRETEAFVLSAIHQGVDFNLTLNTTGGSVTLNTADIIMAYKHPSKDRIWVQYVFGGNTQLLVAKYRLYEFILLVNTD